MRVKYYTTHLALQYGLTISNRLSAFPQVFMFKAVFHFFAANPEHISI